MDASRMTAAPASPHFLEDEQSRNPFAMGEKMQHTGGGRLNVFYRREANNNNCASVKVSTAYYRYYRQLVCDYDGRDLFSVSSV